MFCFYTELKDKSVFHDVTNLLEDYLSLSPRFANDISSMLVGVILQALQEQTDMESVMLLMNDLITADNFCSSLADVHFIDCLFALMDLYPEEKNVNFLLSLLAYLTSFGRRVIGF